MGRKKGLIVKSREPRVVHGLTLKEWQRTPKQLVQEYCQRQKRPKPQYRRAFSESGYRSRIILPDTKNQAKDINLVTNESFTDKAEAENAVALLALSVVDGTRQYERSLPEMYCAAWLSLTGRAKKVEGSGMDSRDKDKDGVLSISARGKYTSQHARDQASLARKTMVNKKNKANETFKRANPYARIIVSSVNQSSLEEICYAFVENTLKTKRTEKELSVDSSLQNKLERLGFDKKVVSNTLKVCQNDEMLCLAYILKTEKKLPAGFQSTSGLYEKVTQVISSNTKKKELSDSLLEDLEVMDRNGVLGVQQFCAVKNLGAQTFSSFIEEMLWFIKGRFDINSHTGPENNLEDELLVLEALLNHDISFDHGSVSNSKGEFDVLSFSKNKEFLFKLWLVKYSKETPAYPSFPILVEFYAATRNRIISFDKSALCLQEVFKSELINEPHIFQIFEFANELAVSEKYWNKLPKYHFQFLEFGASEDVTNTESIGNLVKGQAARKRQIKQHNNEDFSWFDKFIKLQETIEFKERQKEREKLPANKHRSSIMPLLLDDRVIIIKGETGCGKTTQIPQMILHDLLNTNVQNFNIVCTQPRRVAAIGVATRVAYENATNIGDLIGYHIRHDRKCSNNTKLTFMTIGILLRQFINDKTLSSVTHLVIDEVHERSKDIDFLLALLIQLLRSRKDLKVILMSATIDETIFVRYFSAVKKVETISIPGRTFPVQNYFIDDLPSLFEINLNKPSGKIQPRVNYGLIKRVLRYISSQEPGAVLVFLPGVGEISRLQKDLVNLFPEFVIYPLHSLLKPQDQMKCFNSPPKGKRKVVLSTNIAETSVTISDIVFVVDSGLEKQTSFNSLTKFTKLETGWVSKASAKQRRGRAGRVRNGVCFKIFFRSSFEHFQPSTVPEIKRVSIDKLILESIEINTTRRKRRRSVKQFLRTFIEPPSDVDIDESLSFLSLIGALHEDQTLTALGKYLVKLPVDILAGKMMIFGCLLNLSYESIIIAAGLSVKSLFRMPTNEITFEILADKRKELFKENHMYLTKSDHILLLNVYLQFSNQRMSARKQFCETYLLNFKALQEMSNLVREFTRLLENEKFTVRRVNKIEMTKETVLMLKAVICAGLFPSVANVVMPVQQYIKTVSGVKEKDADPSKIKFFSKKKQDNESSRLFVHPTSLNFSTLKYDSPWMVYSEVFQTSKPFMRQITNISAYSILFFAGNASIDYKNEVIEFDGWMKFRVKPRLAVLLTCFKRVVDEYLESLLNIEGEVIDEKSNILQLVRTLIIGAGFHI